MQSKTQSETKANTAYTPLKRRRLPLRALLIVPFVAQIFGAVALTGYISFRNGQESVNRVASELRQEINGRIQDRLQHYLAEPHRINRLNAAAAQYGTLDLADREALMSHFWQQIQVHELVSLIYLGDATGRFISVSRELGSVVLEEARPELGGRYFSYIPDATGRPAELQPETVDRTFDPRVRPWYIATEEARQPVWSPIYTFFNPPSLGLTATWPIFDDDGNITTIFSTDLTLGIIDTFLNQLEIGRTGQGFVLERQTGVLLGTSTDSLPYGLDNNGDPEMIQGVESTDPVIQATAQAMQTEFETLMAIDQTQQFDFDFNGERLFVEVAPLQDEFGIDWLAVVVIPESDFMTQINANTRTTILLCGLTLVLATAVGVVMARWISGQVNQLRDASGAIAAGDLDRQVKVTGIAELESLGQTFNQMAQQLRQSFQALAQVNQVLEHRVADRTQALQAANNEIQLLNEKLQAENVRMSAELDVVRQLQQMILPRDHELTQVIDLDIAGFMEAAEEVGGDYFDVLHGVRGTRIGIGDVTGHGLESGVMMIMAQTAVRTLLALGEHDPVKSFVALNQVLYSNARRMNSDKNMTLALIDYHEGALLLAGQHEEALVVRVGGTVERVDTLDLGFPMALVEDVAEFVAQQQVYLNSGDGVVLYTDGITEAENCDRTLYGIERLMEAIQRNWHRSAREIQQAVIADVHEHIGNNRVYDDITLVVLKRLQSQEEELTVLVDSVYS